MRICDRRRERGRKNTAGELIWLGLGVRGAYLTSIVIGRDSILVGVGVHFTPLAVIGSALEAPTGALLCAIDMHACLFLCDL